MTGVAGVLRALVDRELPFAVTQGVAELGTGPTGYGLLNLLHAARAALDGASVDTLAEVLTADLPTTVTAVRRLDDRDAAITRAFLPLVGVPSVRDLVATLESEGLIEPDAA